MSNISQVPFYSLAALGVIEGVVGAPLVVGASTVTEVFSDVSDFGDIVFPIAGETWEVESDNPADTALGAGLRSLVLIPYDSSSVIGNAQIIPMAGVAAVPVAGSDNFRVRLFSGFTAGTVKGTNIGTITLRVAGGGPIRAQMRPGNGVAFNSFYHVPANKVAIVLQTAAWTKRGQDASARSANFDSAATNGATNIGGSIPIYQNSIVFPIEAGAIPEKFDFWTEANTENVSADVTTVSQIVEFDKDAFNITMASVFFNSL